jgi:general stress protein 26
MKREEATMATEAEIEGKFWRELRTSPIVMLGLDGVDEGRSQPMTAFFEDEQAPLWFFSSSDTALAEHVASQGADQPAIASFTARGHDLFASIHGTLSVERDPAIIDRFWDGRIADWYERGRNDPKLVVLRLDADQARIWLSAFDFSTPIRRLLGQRLQAAYAGKVAEVLL